MDCHKIRKYFGAMGMQKKASSKQTCEFVYLFFFINIYNIEIVFVFLPPPKSVPNKKCFQTGMPSFHSNPFYFISKSEPSLKRFTPKLG